MMFLQANSELAERSLVCTEPSKTFNLDFLRAFLYERLLELRLVEPEGTYFA